MYFFGRLSFISFVFLVNPSHFSGWGKTPI